MEYDTFYITPDAIARNAPMVVDHRGGTTAAGLGGIGGILRPGSTRPVTTVTPAIAAPVAAATVAAPASVAYQYPQPVYSQPVYPPPGYAPWLGGAAPGYVYPPMRPASTIGSVLNGFDLGSLAHVGAQIIAAILPLPQAPTPQDTDTEANTAAAVNSSNLIRYQQALAGFARRDQQILTIGTVLKEILSRNFTTFGG